MWEGSSRSFVRSTEKNFHFLARISRHSRHSRQSSSKLRKGVVPSMQAFSRFSIVENFQTSSTPRQLPLDAASQDPARAVIGIVTGVVFPTICRAPALDGFDLPTTGSRMADQLFAASRRIIDRILLLLQFRCCQVILLLRLLECESERQTANTFAETV